MIHIEYIDEVGFILGLVVSISGAFLLYYELKKYPIKVKARCVESWWESSHGRPRVSYVIDGKEYEVRPNCAGFPKRRGKIYKLRVNKDDPEDSMTFPVMSSLMWLGLVYLFSSFGFEW